jgi:hypothetical protein
VTVTIAIGLAFLAVLGVGWLIGRLAQPPKLNRVSDNWLDHHKYDRRQQRPD